MKIDASEILPFEEYEPRRDAIRARVMEEKRLRRPEEIRHEVDTYNDVLGAAGELGCSLLIEIAEPKERDDKLRAWLGLPENLYVKLEDGRKVRPAYDRRQVGEDRLSSVQYLKFPVGGAVPVAVGCDLPAIAAEVALTPEQRRALEADLRA